MDSTEQQRTLEAVALAAAEEGCLVAPVGSVYFLLQGSPRITTKDFDAVLHDASLEPPSLQILERVAARLGTFTRTQDQAVIQIHRGPSGSPDIELIRGRSTSKGGFFPRELLREAAKQARRQGNVLIYPLEYVVVLKADAAIDREDRAKRDSTRAAEHEIRANSFRADVFSEVNAALLRGTLSTPLIASAISHLKKSRRERVRQLIAAAGADV